MIPPESIRVSHLHHAGHHVFTVEWCSASHPDSTLITHQAESYARPHSHDRKPWVMRAVLHDRSGPDIHPMIIDIATLGDEHSAHLNTAPDYTRDHAPGPTLALTITDTDPHFTTCRHPKIFQNKFVVSYHRCEVHRDCHCNGYRHTHSNGGQHRDGLIEAFQSLTEQEQP